jgi:hypothetical protein
VILLLWYANRDLARMPAAGTLLPQHLLLLHGHVDSRSRRTHKSLSQVCRERGGGQAAAGGFGGGVDGEREDGSGDGERRRGGVDL